MRYLIKIIKDSSIPKEFRSSFIHLYFDMAWFGVLSGSAVNFLNVYATRIGATGFQIGLIGGVSALVSLLFAIPSGKWLENRPNTQAVFWASLVYRLGFLSYILIPWIPDKQAQLWILIFLSLIMGIPLVAFTVGFNTLFAETVPREWRAQVAGNRNVILSILFMLSSLVSGYLLTNIAFPLNYQIVFLIGFFGAIMSSVHLYFITHLNTQVVNNSLLPQLPTTTKSANDSIFRRDIWETPFRNTLWVMGVFHVAQYLAMPLFPLYFVRYLNLTDQELGIGTALFYLSVLLGSMRLSYLVKKNGHKNITGWGVVGMALYPGLLSISSLPWHFFWISIIGGLAWAFVGGASVNYILEKCPDNDRTAHLAWYNIILNAAMLIGSLLGPAIAEYISLPMALLIFSLARFIAGIAIIRWG